MELLEASLFECLICQQLPKYRIAILYTNDYLQRTLDDVVTKFNGKVYVRYKNPSEENKNLTCFETMTLYNWASKDICCSTWGSKITKPKV